MSIPFLTNFSKIRQQKSDDSDKTITSEFRKPQTKYYQYLVRYPYHRSFSLLTIATFRAGRNYLYSIS